MKNSLLAISVLVVASMPAATAQFQFNLLSITDSNPGQTPKVVFSVTDPGNGAPYDIKTHPAFTSSAVSRMTVQIGWDTVDIHNTGSGSEFAATPAAGQPISVNALSTSFSNGDGTFTVVFTKPIPVTATGTGMAFLEGRMAAQDVTGAYSIQAPVKGAYKYFVITGTGVVPRRQIVDRNRCNTCHTVLTVHGNQRTDELNGCVLCHNPNATDIPYRQYGDGPETPINFEYLVHSIHRGTTRYTPFKVIGFGHSINDFSGVKLQNPPVRNCEACHLPGTYLLPLSPKVQGMTVNTQSVLTATLKTVDNDPANNLRITPTASVCSACHEGPTVHSHMLQYGAAFDVLQQSISSGAVTEQCATCHGAGKSRDVFICHNEPNPFPRLSALSVNSGVLNTGVPVTITGANLTGATLRIAGTGVTASSVVIAATKITATLNVAANATLGGHVITVVTSGGTSEGLTFNVVPPSPLLTAIAPASGPAGGAVAVALSGSNLSGATLAVSGTAVTISAVSASASQINATLSIAGSAAAGNVILTATTSGGLSNGVIFGIDAALPADFAISASPSVRTVPAGASTDYAVSVAAIGGFSGSVGFTASGMPTGVTATFNPATVTGGGTSIMSLTIPAGTVPGSYPLTITASSGSLTHTGSVGLTVIAAGAGSLTGSVAAPAGTVLLTPEGSLDWTHWGLSTSASFDRKAGVPQSISNFTVLGSASASRYGNNSSGFTWTDGTPTVTATGSTTGLYVSGQNNGFRITVPADTTPKTLRVYVGAWRTQGSMTAELSDGSAPVYVDTSLSNTAGATTLGVYTLTYRASSAGQTMSVSFIQTKAGGGNVTLQAATLAAIPAPDFALSATPLNQAVQAGAVARYTATVAAKNGFSGTVGFSVSGLPAGVTAGFSPATVAGNGSSTLSLMTTAGTASGTYPLTITGSSSSLIQSTGITLTVTSSATGLLSGTKATPASTVQLTTEGTLDWAHWGLATASDFDHKAGVAQQIGNVTAIGGATVSRYTNNSAGFSWTDGMPAASAINSTTGVFMSGANNGFQITVPAGAISRTLKVYVGAWHTQGRLVAHLSDGSAVDYVDTSLSNAASPTSLGVYTLTFRAASDGQTLTVTFTNASSAGNVTLQAATLAP